jgi:S-DNA-T family DNA segregation ATPase FtsK/SpoIIIE
MGYLGVYLGQGLDGTDQQVFMSAWPHALVGGTTGSGKTTLLRSLLTQVSRAAPELGRLIIVDGKGETDYFGVAPDAAYAVPFVGPQTEPNSAVEVVRWILNEEIPRRRRLVREAAETTGARFDARMDFLDAVRVARPPLLVPLLVVIDEFGELMLRGQYRDEFEASVQSIGAMGRSAMIHLVLATQRPERAVVPGIIKGNLPCRIALKLPTTSDSMTILGHGGAERLAGRGDMLYEPPEGSARRLQGYQV